MSRPHVLLVDNDPFDAELAREILEAPDLGAEVTVVRGGEEALQFLRGAQPAPHLVLLDVNMPRLNGFEVLARLRACPRWRGLPVVLFSTSDDERDVQRGLSGGATAYLVKPMRLDALEEVLRALVTCWRTGVQTSSLSGA